MAPTDFDYLATRNEIIQGALETVGAREAEQAPDAAMLSQAVRVLQQMVKHWSNRGVYLWDFTQETFVTVAAQEAYSATLTASIIGLDKAWIVDGTEDIPLEVVTWSRYLDIFDKETATGRPTTIAFKSAPAPTMYLWPSPDAVYTIKTAGLVAMKDFETAATNADFLARFQLALEYGLTDLLFDKYPGPMNERDKISKRASELFYEAKSFQVVTETTNEVESFYGRRS